MYEIILKDGTYVKIHSALRKRVTGISLQDYVLNLLSSETCCDKDIVAANVTISGTLTLSGDLSAEGGITAGTMIAGFYPVGATNDIAAGTGGAISVTNYFTTINTDAGGDAFTLADGTEVGQLKLIRLVADGGGDAVITPANLSAGTTITMDDAADEVELIWNGTEWIVIKNLGATVA